MDPEREIAFASVSSPNLDRHSRTQDKYGREKKQKTAVSLIYLNEMAAFIKD
jgi:hypothetical protein